MSNATAALTSRHGIANMARRREVPFHQPGISVRTGDTSQKERAQFKRHPAEILITTPESLYLLLTSEASASLRSVDTVIIDEIHALVPTKRGAHLALSLERLQAITSQPLPEVGLGNAAIPEVAHFWPGRSQTSGKSDERNPAQLRSKTSTPLAKSPVLRSGSPCHQSSMRENHASTSGSKSLSRTWRLGQITQGSVRANGPTSQGQNALI